MLHVLLISNNPLSSTENNGKTLASFFRDWDEVQLAQLYFRPELPDAYDSSGRPVACRYDQVTDSDVLRRRPGRRVESVRSFGETAAARQGAREDVAFYRTSLRNRPLIRLLREGIWRLYPFLKKNADWLAATDAFRPDLIFFCAGDFAFAYRLVEQLRRRYGCKLFMYVTDDYILPYPSCSPFFHLRRRQIRRRMLACAHRATGVFTIGATMQQTYRARYGMASHCLVNHSEDHYTPYQLPPPGRPLRLVYAGGLHYDRDLVLGSVIRAVERIHAERGKTCFEVDIYAGRSLPPERLERLNTSCSRFHGPVGSAELVTVLQAADVLLFVESADPQAVRATRLSLSTKVPEYLSYHRCILTIGDKQSSSVDYLSEYGLYAADHVDQIAAVLRNVVDAPEILEEMAGIGYSRFTSHHLPEAVRQAFRDALTAV